MLLIKMVIKLLCSLEPYYWALLFKEFKLMSLFFSSLCSILWRLSLTTLATLCPSWLVKKYGGSTTLLTVRYTLKQAHKYFCYLYYAHYKLLQNPDAEKWQKKTQKMNNNVLSSKYLQRNRARVGVRGNHFIHTVKDEWGNILKW